MTAFGPHNYHLLVGTKLVAEDGTYLGTISPNAFDAESILNEFSAYGSEFGAFSIFNEFGSYGGEFAPQSPFNEFSHTPPKIMRGSTELGRLTVNEFVVGGVHTKRLVAWLKSQ